MGGGRGKQYCLQIPICIDLPQVDCVSTEGVRDACKASKCKQRSREMCVSDDQKKTLRKFKICTVHSLTGCLSIHKQR